MSEVQELVSGENPLWMLDETAQQRELSIGEFDEIIAAEYCPACQGLTLLDKRLLALRLDLIRGKG